MNNSELSEIINRWRATTPGIWVHFLTVGGLSFIMQDGDNPEELDCITDFPRKRKNARSNAEFIAHAHQDIPKLCAEIKRLQKIIIESGAAADNAAGSEQEAKL